MTNGIRYFEKDFLSITAPLVKLKDPCLVSLVDRTGPHAYRKAIYRIAQYFRREFQYDFVQFSMEDSDYYQAYIWIHPQCDELSGTFYVPVIGACCFRQEQDDSKATYWYLQWIWFHPYFRRQGFLTRQWPYFLECYGAFEIEQPWSEAMERFLKKQSISVQKEALNETSQKSLCTPF